MKKLIFLFFVFCSLALPAQQVLDDIVGVVGGHIILESEISLQLEQMSGQGYPLDDNSRCAVFEDYMFQKLLVHQAEVDSVEVSDKQVDDELDRRLNYFLSQMGGSETEFEKHFNKSILEFKEEFRPIIKNNLLAQQMRSKITTDVKITPAEVRQYFNKLPKDSLPLIPAKYELAQVILKPVMNSFERSRIYTEIENIRNGIVNKGKDFGQMARLYSDDPGSKANNGELPFMTRDQLVPEFSAVAFTLKPGEVSEIVETEFGFHIIQMLEKKGQLLKVRHILKSPKIYSADMDAAHHLGDSLFTVVQGGKITFGEIASKYSTDPASKDHGGLMTNPQTGDSKFMAEELDPEVAAEISVLKAGESTKPTLIVENGKQVFRILKLVSYTEAHTASLSEDFDQIKSAALADKQKQILQKWVKKNVQNTYTRVGESYTNCAQSKLWLNH